MNLNIQSIKNILKQIEQDRNIDGNVLMTTLKSVLIDVMKKKIKKSIILDVEYSNQNDNICLYQLKKIVKKVLNKNLEINIKNIKTIKDKIFLGEFIKFEVNIQSLGRIAARKAKYLIVKKIKSAEKDLIYHDYNDRKGKLVTGIVKRLEEGNIIINLGKSEGVIPYKEQIHAEYIRAGDKILTYVIGILKHSKIPQIILSRNHKKFVQKLFEQEIPEILDKNIHIYNIAREPGFKTKVLIHSIQSMDPIKTCMGIKGIRIKNIMEELKNEKIEIIVYSKNIAKLICNAIEPIEISKIIIREKNHSLRIIIPNSQLSLAIGNQGKNIKLAMELINWKIEIQSDIKVIYEKYYMNEMFCTLKNLHTAQILSLYNNNIKKFNDIIKLNDTSLLLIFGIKNNQLTQLKFQINFLIFIEKIHENQNLTQLKKETFNLFNINDNMIKQKHILNIKHINISSNLIRNFKLYFYNYLSFYCENSYCLSILFKIDIASVYLLQFIIEYYIYIAFNKKILRIK